jgi:hypothetical protein
MSHVVTGWVSRGRVCPHYPRQVRALLDIDQAQTNAALGSSKYRRQSSRPVGGHERAWQAASFMPELLIPRTLGLRGLPQLRCNSAKYFIFFLLSKDESRTRRPSF